VKELEELVMTYFLELVDVGCFEVVLVEALVRGEDLEMVVIFLHDLVDLLVCENVDFAEDFQLLVVDAFVEEVVRWLVEDELFVESADVFVVLLAEEVEVGAGPVEVVLSRNLSGCFSLSVHRGKARV
jgi:hypothetical protein